MVRCGGTGIPIQIERDKAVAYHFFSHKCVRMRGRKLVLNDNNDLVIPGT